MVVELSVRKQSNRQAAEDRHRPALTENRYLPAIQPGPISFTGIRKYERNAIRS